MVIEKAKKVRQAATQSEEIKLQKQIQQTQAMTFRALQKELKMEELLEKEEEEKEHQEQQALIKQMNAEKEKNECLMRSIKEKQIEDQYNMSKVNAEKAIERIKEEAKNQIMIKRAQMKQKIETMRKKNERKKAAMKSEIISLRTVMADKVQKIHKMGDIKNCFVPDLSNNEHKKKIEEYCSINYADNYGKFSECKSENFCYTCCESEFGEINMIQREQCYGKCDNNKTN